MIPFDELYHKMLEHSLVNNSTQNLPDGDKDQLDCLLHPEKHPLIWQTGNCNCMAERQQKCVSVCEFGAITPQVEATGIAIDNDKCVGCHSCIDICESKKLTASKDILPTLEALRTHKGPVYALVAPAFSGQFGDDVSAGKLRKTLKLLGFAGMIEVALFADILTLKEALEFDHNIKNETDYQLTSCCCPMWIAMIRRIYHQLLPNVPGAVSPMIACGRTVKILYPDAMTVFIGPCLAKKAEAKEIDVADAVDFVLTFQELRDVFEVLKIDPASQEEDNRDHSSRTGIIYARAGGVSEAVKGTLEHLNPDRDITIRVQTADGVPRCKAMINDILAGKSHGNFFEGMGCVGGCVGGPKAIIKKEDGRVKVDEYGNNAQYATPIDNPYVIELLKKLGFTTVEELLENSDIFTRQFN